MGLQGLLEPVLHIEKLFLRHLQLIRRSFAQTELLRRLLLLPE
jgi:hypothetical protein